MTGQYAAVDEIITGRQNLVMFGRLHQLGRTGARRRAEELLARFDLTEAADRSVSRYSGGMRRRLDLAASLVRTPEVLFLDEPTTGLDPRSRNQVWDGVRALAAAGTTVLLTTQYLDEADQLAEQLSVMDGGAVVAQGTPAALKSSLGGDRVEVVVHDRADLAAAARLVERVCGAEPDLHPDVRRVGGPVSDPVAALSALVQALPGSGVVVEDLGVRRPTLDEAFLHLTGKDAADTAAAADTTTAAHAGAAA